RVEGPAAALLRRRLLRRDPARQPCGRRGPGLLDRGRGDQGVAGLPAAGSIWLPPGPGRRAAGPGSGGSRARLPLAAYGTLRGVFMSRGRDRITAVAFLCVGAGAALHWPDFVMAASMHFRLVGMPTSPSMLAGMALIVLGLVLGTYAIARPTPPSELEQ